MSSFHGNSSENSDNQHRQQGEVLRPVRAHQNSGLGAFKDLENLKGTIPEVNDEDGEDCDDDYIEDVNGALFKNAFKRGPILTEFSSRDKQSEDKILSAAKVFINFSSPDYIMQRRKNGVGESPDNKSSDIYLVNEDDNNDFSRAESDKKIKIVT